MGDLSSLALALSGRYEIERELGAGGMATVYLARDVKHARHVALKVLHPDLAAALGPERFLAEIRTTANLQHPHILPLHDSGDADGHLFYVMPFVAGETVRQRLERETQLGIDDAVRIAREVLSALDYAHRKGIVHRDIKPENILLHDGAALVADFGIALAVQSAAGQRMTQTGLSLGTPQYMSPEQAMGEKHIDGRADIYATGAVLYEMLTGEPPFSGASVQAIVAKVMTERPMSPRTVRDTVPAHVEEAVLCALAKLPADRFAIAKDFSDALDGRGPSRAVTGVTMRTSSAPSVRRRVATWLVAGTLGALASRAATTWKAGRAAPIESVRFAVEPPPGMRIYDGNLERPFALSPDGRSVLFVAGPNRELFLRRLDELRPTRVAGVERAFTFQFSSDGEWIAYAPVPPARGLRKVRVDAVDAGGTQTLMTDSAPQRFASMHGTDIVYVNLAGLWRIPFAGGSPRLIVRRDSTGDAWAAPFIFEDGRTVAFSTQPRGRPQTTAGGLSIMSIDGGPVTKVDLEVQNVVGYADGVLVYGVRDGGLLAVRFDLASRKVRSEPVRLLDNVASRLFFGVAASLGANGTLAYMSGTSTNRVDIVDERGVTLSTLPLEPRQLSSVNWSPDGTRVLLQSAPLGASDLWVYDTATRVATRLTQDGRVQGPVWMPDGKRVAFLGSVNLKNAIMSVPADGSAAPEPIAAAAQAGVNGGFSFSSDATYLLVFVTPDARNRFSTPFIAVPLAGGPAIPLLSGVKFPFELHTSPDSRWMAYSSEEGERREVYLRPFPSGAGRVQVSTNGGDAPSWSRDGRRLFYRTPTAFRVATLDVSGPLARLVRDDSLFANIDRKDFSIHPDGKRFALLREAGEGAKLVVVTHWLDEARAKLRAHQGK